MSYAVRVRSSPVRALDATKINVIEAAILFFGFISLGIETSDRLL